MLCDISTPALLLDCTTARQRGFTMQTLLETLNEDAADNLSDLVYVHCSVITGRDPSAGPIGTTTRSGASSTPSAEESVVLATLDTNRGECGGNHAFLGLGMNNHYTGGYYWGRSSGPGAAMPAPGVELVDGITEAIQLRRVENSNDGKRSEWCEFLMTGDQLQIVPGSVSAALEQFDTLVGITRDGDRRVPAGAEPLVEAAWTRQRDSGRWAPLPWSLDFDDKTPTQAKTATDFFALWAK